MISFILALFLSPLVQAAESCPKTFTGTDLAGATDKLLESVMTDCGSVFPTLREAIDAQAKYKKPLRYIKTGDKNFPEFPSYSQCDKSFFRVATVSQSVDKAISADGWKSGWMRREEELKASGKEKDKSQFDGLPPTASFEDRIIEYVRVKNKPSEFPKHSSVVGVLENPIRTLSVGYHTGYNAGMRGDHMHMDEVEVGACAKSPECQKIKAHDSTVAFKSRGLTPRYSTEGEHAIEMHIPKSCVVATYRIKFAKVDDKCYSDKWGNCGAGPKTSP